MLRFGGTNPNCDAKFEGFFITREIGFHRARFTMPGELRLKRLVIRGDYCTTISNCWDSLDSTRGILRTVAMTLLGHATDIMFRRYRQSHDPRLI